MISNKNILDFIKKNLPSYYFVLQSWGTYWKTYGGIRALIKSPYLHISIVVSFACFPIWNDIKSETIWYDLCLTIMPNLLGFTLGGYAILLAFGDMKFIKILTGSSVEGINSPYLQVNATFLHFIVCQAISLFIALIGYSWSLEKGFFAWFGFTFFLYSLSTSFAAAHAIMRLAKWFDRFNQQPDETRDTSIEKN